LAYLDTEITYLKGVGPNKADILNSELGVKSYRDLLFIYPFRYIDKTQFVRISDAKIEGEQYLMMGRIRDIELTKGQNKRYRLSATLTDGSGIIELIWFQMAKYIEEFLQEGQQYVVYGKLSLYGSKRNIAHPEVELFQEEKLKQLSFDPVYSSTEKLDKSWLDSKGRRKIIKTILEGCKESDIPENLPDYLIDRLKLPSRFQALKWIHFPENQEQITLAQNRIKFEEFFFLQLQILYKKKRSKTLLKGPEFKLVGEAFNQFYHHQLPFELTGAQKRVIKQIRSDMAHGFQMNRLLQGDVGSGKTVVGVLTMLIALDNGYQSCLMAPTEILANQHYHGISEMLEGMHIRVAFLSGSVKGKKRAEILDQLQNGEIDVLVGTHALIEDTVVFKNLGLAIIDEQHRFGVGQRSKLWKKNESLIPHVLVMTATPIPRTLAMTLYGDLDQSVIDELPPGRKHIKTIHKYDNHRPELNRFLKAEIAKGRQIYVVYPLIEESEKLDLRNLMDGYERMLQEFPRPEYQISIVHGKMKASDKDMEMKRFISGHTQILVATTVIEVGVNVPNASVMVIENAERFGLSQLHQLRGRVGRGAEQSYCILMSSFKLSKEGKERLSTMVRTNNGFEIAEVDLRLRGPGDMEGTRQSGVIEFKLLNLGKDQKIIDAGRYLAEKVLEDDPELTDAKNIRLRNYLDYITKGSSFWSLIS
jgi:ATP-dependent DNA helicase RecG